MMVVASNIPNGIEDNTYNYTLSQVVNRVRAAGFLVDGIYSRKTDTGAYYQVDVAIQIGAEVGDVQIVGQIEIYDGIAASTFAHACTVGYPTKAVLRAFRVGPDATRREIIEERARYSSEKEQVQTWEPC